MKQQKSLHNSVEVQIAKERLQSLDGLRGLAALGVVLFHSGFNVHLLNLPILQTAYNAFAVGPNSVQILFVLSGFLMAYLYQNIKSPLTFLQKRYLRIVPALTVVALYIWLAKVFIKDLVWFQKIPIFIVVVIVFSVTWRLLRKFSKNYNPGKSIFFVFILLQIISAIILSIIIPRLTHNETVPINQIIRDVIVLVSNITLTTPFSQHKILLDSVFWSLFPEMLFYILFPFLVVPLIHFCRKSGWLLTILVIIIVGKILLDLDTALSPLNSFLDVNIARSNGFVVGVLVGTLYFTNSPIFEKAKKLVEKPFLSILILFLFFAAQWGDTALSGSNKPSVEIMNIYYVVTSWVIGLTIIAAISKTIINKLFSLRIFTFLGMISYSMYLFHHSVFDWTSQIFDPIKVELGSNIFLGLLYLFVSLGIVIVSSYFLFRLIESLYFAERKNIQEAVTNTFTMTIPRIFKIRKVRIVSVALILIVFIIFVYTAIFPFSFIVEKKKYDRKYQDTEQIVVGDKNFETTVTSSYPNFSLVLMNLSYGDSASKTQENINPPATLKFSLLDDQRNIISHSEREAYKVEGSPNFLFGFVPLTDSTNKKYTISLVTKNSSSHDYVAVNTNRPLLLLYSPEGPKFLTLLNILINRILLILTIPEAIFAICSIISVSIFMLRNERK